MPTEIMHASSICLATLTEAHEMSSDAKVKKLLFEFMTRIVNPPVAAPVAAPVLRYNGKTSEG